MNYRAQIAALLPHTMELLGVYQGMSTGEIRKQDGVDDRFARIMHDLARTYYGKTHATRQQAKARQQAIEMGHTWETLRVIESCVNKLNNKDHAWQVRVELTTCVANCRAIRAESVGVLARFNGMQAKNPKNSLSCKPIAGSTKMRVSIVVDQHLGRTAVDKARNQTELDAATAFVTAAALDGSGELPAVEPVVVLPADTSIMGATEHEMYNYMLSLSDGTSVTTLEWAQMTLAEFGWVLVLDPVTGKELGFFRFGTADARFAGPLERKIQKAKTPVCAVEGCACGADKCQMHHIESWISGGPTTLENLTMLCPFHNGRNDDDPTKPRYGRIERINGLDYFVPPFGGRPRLNMSPCAQGGATRLAQKQAGITPQPVL